MTLIPITINISTCVNVQFSGYTNDNNRIPKIISHIYANEQKQIKDYCYPRRKWVNNKSLITVVKNLSKIHTNSIYFAGKNRQKLMTNSNIFYGLSAFTLIAWVKTTSINTAFNTFIEVIPKSLLLSSSLYSNDKEITNLLDSYKQTINKNVSAGIECYDQKTTKSNFNIAKLNEVIHKNDWNHITITYKNKHICYYLNGYKISESIIDYDLSSLPKNYVTIIGGDCLNDLNKSQSCNMYLNDFILYDDLIFDFGIEKFDIPKNGILKFSNFAKCNKISTCRNIMPEKDVKKSFKHMDNINRKVLYNINIKNDTKYFNFKSQKDNSIIKFR